MAMKYRPGLHRRLQPSRHLLPIYQIPDGFQIGSPAIPVVDIVGMFPDIDCQQRLQSLSHRIVGILCLHYGQIPFLVFAQPCPSGPENGGCSLDEFGLEICH